MLTGSGDRAVLFNDVGFARIIACNGSAMQTDQSKNIFSAVSNVIFDQPLSTEYGMSRVKVFDKVPSTYLRRALTHLECVKNYIDLFDDESDPKANCLSTPVNMSLICLPTPE